VRMPLQYTSDCVSDDHRCILTNTLRGVFAHDTGGEISYGHDYYDANKCTPTSTAGVTPNGKLQHMDYDGWFNLVHRVQNQLECRQGGFNVKSPSASTSMRLGDKFRIGIFGNYEMDCVSVDSGRGLGNNLFAAGAVANYCSVEYNGTEMKPDGSKIADGSVCNGRELDVWAKVYVTTIAAHPSQMEGVTHKNIKYGCWKCRRCRNKAIVFMTIFIPFGLCLFCCCWHDTLKPCLIRKRENWDEYRKNRKNNEAFGQENELQIQTLAGDSYAVTDWGLATNLKKLVAKQHPSLGKASTFVLIKNGSEVDPKYGSLDRAALYKVGGDRTLSLVFAGGGMGSHKAVDETSV